MIFIMTITALVAQPAWDLADKGPQQRKHGAVGTGQLKGGG